MNIKERILIVEDEISIARFMSSVLEKEGYRVIRAVAGGEALSIIDSHCPDLVILDLGLPDMDGLSVLEQLRQWSNVPVLVVSARTQEIDKVKAFDMGTDDYITKPFGTQELLARIRTALRHAHAQAANPEIASTGKYTVGELEVDYDRHRVRRAGEDVGLTQIEFRIVALLARYAGKVLTYSFIMKEIWGPHAGSNNQILRVNMSNIRRKIEKDHTDPQYLFTEVGVGYRMATEED